MEEGDLLQAIKLALKARERGIVHFHAHFGTLAATVTRITSKLARIPYILTVHDKDIYVDLRQRVQWEGDTQQGRLMRKKIS